MVCLINFIFDLCFGFYFIMRASTLNSVYHLILGLGFLAMGHYWGNQYFENKIKKQ